MGSLLLAGALLLVPAAADENPSTPDVRRLVRQLDSPQFAPREQAEKQLIEMGPAILDLLPEPDEQTPAEVRQRLGRVRQQLERALAESTARPSLVTLGSERMPVKEVLESLGRQTGNKIVDAGSASREREIAVRFEKTPFWKALDEVLDQADLDIYPYGRAH